MRNSNKLILAYASMKRVILSEKVDVMLTPQFYTLKKESLPIKYAYQARKIAPSLFKGLLEKTNNYDYMVYKEDDRWIFIAYEIEKIIDFLKSKGIEEEQVSKIFFAQQATESFSNPLTLSQKETLITIDDTVVIVPTIVVKEKNSLSFNSSFAPRNGVLLQRKDNSQLSKKQTFSIAIIFILFSIMFVIEGWHYSDTKTKEKMQTLFEANPTLQNSYTRESLLSKYRTTDKIERKKRDTVKAFSDMIFKGVTLTFFDIDEKRFQAQFSCTNTQVATRVKQLAIKKHYKIYNIENSNNLRIEGTL